MKTPPATPSSTAAAGEPLRCPFCDGYGSISMNHTFIECLTCGATGPEIDRKTGFVSERALAAWNRRAAPARQPGTMERVLELARKHESREVLGPAKRVSIDELEKMLSLDPPPKIEIQPDGQVRTVGLDETAGPIAFQFTEKHLLAFANDLLGAAQSQSQGEGGPD